MKKFSFKTFLLITYEIIRIKFILGASPVQDIPYQSLSWYCSVSFLCFPLLFIIFLSIDNEKYNIFRPFIALSKMMSTIGFTSYIGTTLQEAISQVRFSQLYSINIIFLVMFFLLIDVIIGIVFVINPKKDKKGENDICK
jgi:hypothetical protein